METKNIGPIFDTETINFIEKKYRAGNPFLNYFKTSPFYQGQHDLKRGGIQFAMTDDEIKEYAKCKLDIIYFAEKYCKILIPDIGMKIIKLRDYQKIILENFDKNRFITIQNSRQMGTSTIMAICFLYFMMFNTNKFILMLHEKSAMNISIIQKIHSIYKCLPFFLKKGIITWNQTSTKFEDGSMIRSLYSKSELGIERDIDLFFCGDMANLIDKNNIYADIFPIVSKTEKGKMILQTYGKKVFRYKRLFADENNIYKHLKFHYSLIEGRDEKWKNNLIDLLCSEDIFNEDYELE